MVATTPVWMADAVAGALPAGDATRAGIDVDALVKKPKPIFIPPVDLYRETDVRIWTISSRGGFLYFF